MRDQAAAIALRLSRRARKKAEGGAVELAQPPTSGMFGYKIREKLYPGEDEYFKTNPHVAGMASESNDVILNPYSSPDVNRDAVARNEALRLHMRERGIVPSFEVTPEQSQSFRGTAYGSNPDAMKQTIAARIYSGDPSAMATDAQRRWLDGLIGGAAMKAEGGPVEDQLIPPPRTPSQLPDAWNEAVRTAAKRAIDTASAPGRALQGGYGVKPETPGLWSEEDEFRASHAQQKQVEDATNLSLDVAQVRPIVEEKIHEIAKRIQQAEHPTVPDIIKKSPGEWTPQEVTEVQNFYKKLPDKEKAVWETYARHAGEVESRNVERRMDFTPQQIREQAPWKTEDRARNKQIVLPQEDGMKRGGSMQRTRGYAAGGASKVPGPSFFQRDANRALSRQSGLIKSVVPGRTDKHPMRVASGSYIVPSDIVSHLGQNNTLAGAKFLKRKFGGGGTVQFADGGEVPMPVDIIAAGGEYVLSPDQVRAVGKGDIKKGHDALDRMVLETRKHHIKTLKNLAPPKRS